MSGLVRRADGSFEADLRAFSNLNFFARLRGDHFAVDPFLVSRLLNAALAQSAARDAEGRAVCANVHRLIMNTDDFDELMRLRVMLHRQIGPAML